jgi:beta-glucosidase
MSKKEIKEFDTLKVSIKVKNVGKRGGDEITQLYIRDLVGSVTRPVRELKGFKRINLKAGEEKVITFEVLPIHLGFYNKEMRYVIEPGKFKVMIGGNSVDFLKDSFSVVN